MRRNSFKVRQLDRAPLKISFLKRMDFPDHNHRVEGTLEQFLSLSQVRVADTLGRTFIIHEDDFEYE